MRCSLRAFAALPSAWATALLLLGGGTSRAAEFAPACTVPQSPRDVVASFDAQSRVSIVEVIDPDRVIYTPRAGGEPQALRRCGQHYHFPIENHQRCVGEVAPRQEHGRDGEEHAGEPRPGDVVEVHTVYSAKVNPDRCPGTPRCCDPESLACCIEGPFLVRAFNAKVTGGGGAGPIEPPPGRPLAEWSGSTTCPDCAPGKCKPAAQWSFRLGCGFEISAEQLSRFHHPHEARDLQTGYRVSHDLTLVTP